MILPYKDPEKQRQASKEYYQKHRKERLEYNRLYAKKQYDKKTPAEIQEYNQRPEVKERKRKDNQSPKGKLRHRLYRLRPEKKEMHRIESQRYNLKPEVIARRKARLKKPDIIAKRKMWQVGYRPRRSELRKKLYRKPEAKAKRKEHDRKPEVRARQLAGMRRRNQTPEYKTKNRSAALRFYHRQKERIVQEHDEVKIEALTPYSKKMSNSNVPCCVCVKCREKEIKFLTIDHIHGRRLMGHSHSFSGLRLYKWIIKNNFPDGLQVMCHNCNKAKGSAKSCPVHGE